MRMLSFSHPGVAHSQRCLRSSTARSSWYAARPSGIHFVYIDDGTDMATTPDSLLLKFRAKDTRFGVTRDTVRALASELEISETQVVHMALSRFAEEDDGPLTAKQLSALRKAAARVLPQGKLVNRSTLF